MTVTVVTLLCVGLGVAWLWLRCRVPPGTRQIPAPSWCFPIIGHLPQLLAASKTGYTIPFYTKLFHSLGNIFRLQAINLNIVLVQDPVIIKHFLSRGVTSGAYGKGEIMRDQYGDWMGSGIFVADGQEWSKRREFAKVLFHSSSLRSHVPVFTRAARRLCFRFRTLAQQGPVDVQDYFMRFTLDTFAAIGFGKPLHAIEQDDLQFNKAFDYIQMSISHRIFKGSWWRLFHNDKKYDAMLAYMNTFTEGIIGEVVAVQSDRLRDRDDLLAKMVLKMRQQQQQRQDGHTPSGLVVTRKVLRDFVLNFLVAGRDTTAMLLTWSLHYVAHHPEMGTQLLREVDSVLGCGGKPPYTYERVVELRAMKRFLMEVLRLHPPVALDGLTALRDDVLPGDYFVPKGSMVLYSAYHVHRRPDLYEDPLTFNPDRFIDATPSPYTFMAFHGGPRTCLGMELAYLEARVALVELLREFRFEPVRTKDKDAFQYGVILTFKDGLPIKCIPRV